MEFSNALGESNEERLTGVKLFIKALGWGATDVDWFKAVEKHCPSAGKYGYFGLDNSDLNTLLTLAIQATRGR